jgi:predicted transcriptional regulator of viral defense system
VNQSAAALIQMMHQHDLRIFHTADMITLGNLSAGGATQALSRLADKGILARLKRGLWANLLVKDLNPYEAVPFLTAPWPSYISLYSALADHGVIAELPQIVYGVSPGPTARYQTPIGAFRIHHLPADLIWGYDLKQTAGGGYPLADPEKAFLDLAYLALIPRSPLRFPYKRTRNWRFDKPKLRTYLSRYRYKPLKDYIRKTIPGVLGPAS